MPITIDSSRFGPIDVADEAVIEFPAGLIGLAGSRYTLILREESRPFLWLQSLDDPSRAMPVTQPGNFFRSYVVEISDSEADRIGVSDPSQAAVYVTVRATDKIEDFSANLRAPILISHGQGYQVINQAPDAPVRAPLFAGSAEVAA